MRFLLDENVRAELDVFLNGKKCDVRRLPKGAPDRFLAAASREERRIIVTNDEDFSMFREGTVFGVVLLRLPQHDAVGLVASFQRLLDECAEWKGCRIVLGPHQWTATPLKPKHQARKRPAH
jgi:predicted nuclease of predicted toxin-antitoxin system